MCKKLQNAVTQILPQNTKMGITVHFQWEYTKCLTYSTSAVMRDIPMVSKHHLWETIHSESTDHVIDDVT